jgi:Fe/S biogenesis protein NfuA
MASIPEASSTSEAYSPVLTITPVARSVVLAARAEEQDHEHLALWVEVTGSDGHAYTYDIYFQALSDARPEDVVQHDDELPVVVPLKSVDRLKGARLDWSDEGEGGLVMVNPNTPPRSESRVVPEGDLTSEVARRVLAVLEEQVNPSIAAHGGRADLVAVEEGVAYLRLSGGCQGCGLARVTLSQGIQVAIQEAVPEITSVVDVTDHAGGTNPYFEAAKK